jgi:hypothetical protein
MAGIALAVGLGTAAAGYFEKKSADKTAGQLQATRPKLSDSPYIKDQLSLAESDLSTGMSGGAKAAYESDLDKSLSTSLSAVLKGGGSVNNVGEIFANDQSGRGRLALMKDNLRLAEIDRVARSRDAAEQEREQQFGINEDAPWKDAAQANAQARQGAENQIWSGLGTAGAGLMRGMEGAEAKDDFANYSKVAPIKSTATTAPVASPAAAAGQLNPNADKNLLDSLLANPT